MTPQQASEALKDLNDILNADDAALNKQIKLVTWLVKLKVDELRAIENGEKK